MHNNIMAAGSKDRPPMLAPGRYPQCRSRFLRYVDTRPNGKALRKCILSGPYIPTTVLAHAVKATDDSLAVPEHTTVETPTNMSSENKAHFLKEKEAIHLILTSIGDDIYSTVDACQIAQDMWEVIERSSAPLPKPSIPSRSHTTTRHKGNEIAKPITTPSVTASEEDNDPEQAQRDKDMQKNLALIAKYFKKIYKPTNNNLRTSSNSKNKNVDTTPWYKNDDHSRQFGTQRMVNVAAAREKVGSKVVQQSGIQCFNCKKYRNFTKECRKPKNKDSAYHKEKMLLCKQAERDVSLQAEHYMAKIQEVPTADSGTDSELVEQVQNDAGYNVFANHLQYSEQSESVSNTYLVETDDSNVTPDSPDMCEDDIQNEQNDVESDDERVTLANLIANLKLDVDENKKIQKQLKKANTTLAQELKECKAILAETSKSLGESISVRDSCLVALQTNQAEFEKFKAFNDRTVDYEKLKRKLNDALGQLAHKDTVIREGLKTKAYELSVVNEKHDELMKQSLLTKSHYKGLVKQKTKVIMDLKLKEEHDIEKILSMEKQLKFLNEVVYIRSQSIQTIHMMEPKSDSLKFIHELKQKMHADLKYVKTLEKEIDELESEKAEFSDMYDVILQEGEYNDVKCSYLQSLSDLDALAELQCMYLHKVKECDCLAQKLLKQTESVSQKVHSKLLQRFAKVEKYSISLEIALQNYKEQVKNYTVCNEKAPNVFRKEREQYFEIQDLKAKLQDKNIAISELKKLIEKGKAKLVDTKFDRPSVVRQPNAQRIPKPPVLGKPTLFSNSLDRIHF
uniref:CCHC-type domain-containing protein n=1 Tax=Tanacetum cinerariifolium TaxID=118510 RepID=A0A699H353_TANCI|nr:hypothetical protein [Tanacetum cinerariifolium]